MAENEVPIVVTVESKDAEKSLNNFQKSAEKSVSGIEKAFASLKIVAAAAVAAFAGKQLIDGLSKAVEAASSADKAVAQLNFALAANNEYSIDASKALQDYAKTVQETTTTSDDAATEALALALSFGRTAEQAQFLVDTALDLSAVTKKDLLTSVTELGKSTQGVTPRIYQLQEAMDTLTESQKKADGVLKLVRDNFGGAAKALTDTFSGAVEQATNNFGDIFESAGKVITRNAVVVDGIKILSKAFASLATAIDDNAIGLSTILSQALQSIILLVVKTIDVVNGLINVLKNFDFEALAIAIGAATVALAAFFAVQNFGTIVATANALLFLSGILYSTAAAAIAATAALAPLALSAAATALPFVAIGLVITGILGIIDEFVAKINDTTTIAKRLKDSFSNIFSNFSEGAKSATVETEKTTVSFEDQLAALAKISPALQRVQTEYKNSGKSAKESLGVAQDILQKISTATQEVIEKNKTLRSEASGANAGELEKINLAINLEKEKLAIKEQQLQKDGLLTKELQNLLNVQRKLLDKKAFEQIAKLQLDSVKELQKENKTLSATILDGSESQLEVINKNLETSLDLVDQKEAELAFDGKLTNEAREQLRIRRELLGVQADLAKEKVSLVDQTFGELSDGLGAALGSALDTIGSVFESAQGGFEGLTFDGALASLEEGAVSLYESVGEAVSKITLSDIGEGLLAVGQQITGLLSGEFIQIGTDFVTKLASFPASLLNVFKNFDDVLTGNSFAKAADKAQKDANSLRAEADALASANDQESIDKRQDLLNQAEKLDGIRAENEEKASNSLVNQIPKAIDELVKRLPEIADGLAKSIGSIFATIGEALPQIAESLVAAIEPLIAVIFEKVIPSLIDALPGVIKALLDALPGIITTILKSLPTIIAKIAEAVPIIVKELALAMPEIVAAFAENIGPIVTALTVGLIEAVPSIVFALVDALIVRGGIVKIALSLVKALAIELPIALAKGILIGLQSSLGGLTKFITGAFSGIPGLISDAFAKIPAQLGSAISKVLDKLNPTNLLAKIFSGGKAKPGTIEKILGINIPYVTFAQGGLVPGKAQVPGDSAVNDRIIALLSPGEAVLPRSVTNNPALKPYVDALLSGDEKLLPNFGILGGGGGISIKTVTDAAGAAASGASDFAKSNLGNASKDVLKGISAGAQKAIDLSKQVGKKAFDELKKLNPKDLMEIAKRKAIEGIEKMIESAGARLATGGVIPAGYPNDSFPARLTSGEMVLPTDTVRRLDNFMENDSGSSAGDNEVLIALLAKIASIVSQPVTVETTATVNSKAFADIILSLNRNNARLSA